MIVYKITNLITGKKYIGQTRHSLQKRWAEHCSVRSTCTYLSHAIQKYGKQNFKIDLICRANSDAELNHREEFCIKAFKSLAPNGYNLLSGGNARKPTEETTKKRVATVRARWAKIPKDGSAMKGRPKSTQQKIRTSMSLLGRSFSEERKRNISKAKQGCVAWNKGTVGVMKPNSGSFSKNKAAPNKGRKRVVINGKIKFIKVSNICT